MGKSKTIFFNNTLHFPEGKIQRKESSEIWKSDNCRFCCSKGKEKVTMKAEWKVVRFCKEKSDSKIPYGKSFYWKNQKFPLAIAFKNRNFLFQYVHVSEDTSPFNALDRGILFFYRNENGDHIRIRFNQINFSNQTNFVGLEMIDAYWKEKNFTRFVSAKEIMESFKSGVWCELSQMKDAVENFEN